MRQAQRGDEDSHGDVERRCGLLCFGPLVGHHVVFKFIKEQGSERDSHITDDESHRDGRDEW